jgi:hypothetical protein
MRPRSCKASQESQHPASNFSNVHCGKDQHYTRPPKSYNLPTEMCKCGDDNESDLSHEKPPGYHVVSMDDIVQVVEEMDDALDNTEAQRLNLSTTPID